MIITFFLFTLLLAFNIWLFFIWPKRPMGDKIASVLQIVAVYTFGLGVLTRIGVLPALESAAPSLTSADLLQFLVGNFEIAVIGFNGLIVAVEPSKIAFSATSAIESVFLIILTPVAILGYLAYTLFVMPWAYLAYALTSIPVNAILNSGIDRCLDISGPGIESSSFCFKAAVEANTVAFKNFIVAIPAVSIAFGTKLLSNFSGVRTDRTLNEQQNRSLRGVLRKAVIYSLWIAQGFTAFFLILTVLSMPGVFFTEAEPGEIYGVGIVILLMIVLEVVVYRKVRALRRSYNLGGE